MLPKIDFVDHQFFIPISPGINIKYFIQELFLLVTDQGYLKEPNVVWETLSSVDGAGHYVDHRFVTFTPATSHSDNAEGSSVLSKIASAAEAITLNQSPTAGSIQAANKPSEPSSSAYEDESLISVPSNKKQIDQE